ncbi:penicillin-binding protein 1C [Reichenbachiella sp.]|uniref:penicillin-binding protein 1C n=3 Tax=Reichenbachiella sp. TaxID=2184521 RepID=UPI00329A04D1
MAILLMNVLQLNNYRIRLRSKRFLGISLLLGLMIAYFWFKPSEGILSDKDYSRIVYSRDKSVLRITLSGDDKYRLYSHVNSAGPLIKEAILLKEDQYFYYHPGVNPIATLRAIYETYIKRDVKMGGSTITMQVARLQFGLKTRNVLGKLKQMFYALYLELYFSKDDILEAYINLAPCGGNIEGFGAASIIIFEKELSEITLQEALFLSVLPQSPSKYNPRNQQIPSELTESRLRLYNLWQDQTDAKPEPDQIAHSKMPLSTSYFVPYRAPHFSGSVLRKYKKEDRIYTTLDWKMQKLVTRLTQRYVQRKKRLGVENAAVLLIDYENNMEVLAKLGSVDFFNEKIQGQVDGTSARRSPGSTLKPLVYALAMDQGLIHPMTMLKDAPTSFSNYAPDNYELDFKGPVKTWEALINSRNVPAVSLASRIKEPDLYDFLHTLDLGNLKAKDHYGLSIVLGSAEFSMKELVSMYGILANNGIYQKTNETFTADNHVNLPHDRQYLTPQACWLTRQILMKNPQPNSNTLLAYGNNYNSEVDLVSVGYKTGTSIGFKDCWSIAIFDKYILAVWLGNFNGYGNPVFNGRQLAAPLLFEIAKNIMSENAKSPDYEISHQLHWMPPGIREVEVCAASGQIAHPHCKRKLTTHFIPGKSSIAKCSICREVFINTKTGYRAYAAGKYIKTEVFEFWPTDLLKIFRKAGVPRKTPPIYDPAGKEGNSYLLGQSNRGLAPKIISPMSETEYLMSPSETMFNNLPLRATVDADVNEIYWFVDQQFIGKSAPDETQFWSLRPGTFQIGVVDDKGRTNSRKVKIGLAMN